MQTRQFTRFPGLALAVLFTLLAGSVGADDSKLEGTWDVTLQFTGGGPGCTSSSMQFLTLNTFLKDGGMLFSSVVVYSLAPDRGRGSALGTIISWPASSSSS